MTKVIRDYIETKRNILAYFKCTEDYDIRTMMNCNWTIKDYDEYSAICFWNNDNPPAEVVIAKRGGEPLVIKKDKATMVVVIDCVKVAFVLDNGKMV